MKIVLLFIVGIVIAILLGDVDADLHFVWDETTGTKVYHPDSDPFPY